MFFSASFPPSPGQPERTQNYSQPARVSVDRSGLLLPGFPPAREIQFDGLHRSTHKLARYIDHTLLVYEPDDDPEEAVRQLCREAKQHHFYAVCVRPDKVALAKKELGGSGVKVATVIGFPERKVFLADERANLTFGDVPLWRKLMETQKAVQEGADEVDVVMNVHQFLKEVDQPQQMRTMQELLKIKAFANGKKVKVILETDLLSPPEIRLAVIACVRAGVDIIKTSTGMLKNGEGATVTNVALIRQTLEELGKADQIGIKASGGIHDLKKAEALIKAGATRLGTSQGVAIVSGKRADGGKY